MGLHRGAHGTGAGPRCLGGVLFTNRYKGHQNPGRGVAGEGDSLWCTVQSGWVNTHSIMEFPRLYRMPVAVLWLL